MNKRANRKLFTKSDLPSNPWKVGDVYAYKKTGRLSKKYGLFGKYFVLIKIGDTEYPEINIISRVCFINEVYDSIESIRNVNFGNLLPLYPNWDHEKLEDQDRTIRNEFMSVSLCFYKNTVYPEDNLHFLANIDLPEGCKYSKKCSYTVEYWDLLEKRFVFDYNEWNV